MIVAIDNTKTILSAITLIVLLSTSATHAGGDGSGGGDKYTRDFVAIATQEIYPWLQDHGASLEPNVDADEFLIKINPKQILSVDHVYESCHFKLINDGQSDQQFVGLPQSPSDREVEACYNAETDLTYLSRTLYPLDVTCPSKRALIAHENFRKMKLEGDGYEISKQMPIIGFGSLANQPADCLLRNSAPWGRPRVSRSGTAFISDSSQPLLGKAYRDPYGLIWGSLVTDSTDYDHAIYMSQDKAKKYCKKIGARLPTREDFAQLIIFLGKGMPKGYSPYLGDGKTELLPGLSVYEFWLDESIAYYASGEGGFEVGSYDRDEFKNIATRCVSDSISGE